MSGLSSAEMSSLETLLAHHPTQITETLIIQIEQRFNQLPDVAESIRELRTRIAPPMPPLPEVQWTREQWLRWATQIYMPYFEWTIRYDRNRQHQQACANLFSEWLYDQYPNWLNDDHAPLLLHQYQLLRELLDNDAKAIVVWLVVDGLTWWQGKLLRNSCEDRGLHLQRYEACISVLPSITSVSKRALVTGVPSTHETQTSIAGAARDKLQRLGINGHVSYRFSDALQLAQRANDVRCFIVLFNMLDVLAHQTTDFTDNAGIRGYLADLAASLQHLQATFEAQGRPMHVLVGSDHGGTLLPAEAHNLLLPQTSQTIDDLWEPETTQQETQKPSARAATILYPDRINYDDRAMWYVLDRDGFQLDQHYLVPRAYNYIGRRPSGWTHGGLTPEEVVVPMMHFTTKQIERQPLTIELVGQLRANQPAIITAVIINPNRFSVETLTLDVERGTASLQVERLAPMSKYEAKIEFSSVTERVADVIVQWQTRYDTVSGQYTQRGQQTIAVRRLQTDDSGFDDFFGNH
jgi:hypothetical protein